MRIEHPVTAATADYLHKELIEMLIVRSCLNCGYFHNAMCAKWNATPPPETIVYSCPSWTPRLPF